MVRSGPSRSENYTQPQILLAELDCIKAMGTVEMCEEENSPEIKEASLSMMDAEGP